MIETPMDILKEFPVRKTRKQKKLFRESIQSYAEKLGYQVTVEAVNSDSRNIVIGDPETARYLITAHYDTASGLWCPNWMVPTNPLMHVVCLLLNTVVLMLPAFALGAVAAWFTRDPFLTHLILLVGMVCSILLMAFGPANRHNANSNTSGVVALLETAVSMPRNLRRRVCFVLLDREERGMQGAVGYRKKHYFASKYQTVLDLSCVGDGETILLVPSTAMRSDVNLLCLERKCGDREVKVWKKKYFAWSSSHRLFPRSVAVAALHRGKLGYWLKGARTRRDTVLDYTNINILRACLISYISSPAAE